MHRILLALALLAAVAVIPSLNAADAEPAGSPSARQRIAVPLSHAPALDVAATLNKFYAAEGSVLATGDPLSNTLLLSASPKALDEVQRLAKQLDQPPPGVAIEAAIVEVSLPPEKDAPAAAPLTGKGNLQSQVDALQRLGKVQVLARPSLWTLHNQPASLKVESGKSKADTSNGKTESAQTSGQQHGGLTLAVIPRVTDDGQVALAIDLQATDATDADEKNVAGKPAGAEESRSRKTQGGSFATHCTPLLADGQTATIVSLTTVKNHARSQLVVLVSAKIVRPDPPGRPSVPARR